MAMPKKYDAIVIGAGMSGMACAIRLGMFGKKVALLEKHSIPGGLNSYYQRGKIDQDGKRVGVRKFDVGLHALTNFARKNSKKNPLIKVLRQLRIPYDDLKLKEQSESRIQVGDIGVNFSNNFDYFVQQIEKSFPENFSHFQKLVEFINTYDDNQITTEFVSGREFLERTLQNSRLVEIVLFPTLIYGSSWENDVDLRQFVILFKSIYMEGFARPYGGVRTLIEVLENKIQENNVDLLYRSSVKKIVAHENQATEVHLENGEVLRADQIYSSAGLAETYSLLGKKDLKQKVIGNLSFVELLFVYDKNIDPNVCDKTIIFYNETESYEYKKPDDYVDTRSAVVCFTDNYREYESDEGLIRITFIANYEKWKTLNQDEYKTIKEKTKKSALELIKKVVPQDDRTLKYWDAFTPRTIEKYTSHFKGAVYGATQKIADGKTSLKNLFVIGTDQGFLGIVGSLLSGISVANMYGSNLGDRS
ncbi:MAG: NAD(P)/FAD-dependent oxidoreductase [Halobacteriovoraceae bacterium]|nr:NAD(P)/FAD-dependent oxidoreductase [Halobacteriovoraceae bacterium]MCB9093549.1 NAD(P)/FAD-dependent oxidoreductase [Halobacteriovoraceae bacterium]